MKTRTWRLMLLGLFLVATVGSVGAQAPGQTRATEGWWDRPLTWPVQAFHMVVLKNGNVLAFGKDEPTTCILFDPDAGIGGEGEVIASFSGPIEPIHKLLCTGHTALADGKILFTGSSPDVATTTLYDPDVFPPGPASWIPQDNGITTRFYPTCTLLGDGTVLVTAGREWHDNSQNTGANTSAIFNPNADSGKQWSLLTDAKYCGRNLDDCNGAPPFHLDQYPFMFPLSTGDVIYVGSDDGAARTLWSTKGTWSLNTTEPGSWTEIVSISDDPILGGSAVMYRPNQIMKAGGRIFDPDDEYYFDADGDGDSAISRVYTLDMRAENHEWTPRPDLGKDLMGNPPLGKPRTDHIYLLVLPDGKILATNGQNDAGAPVLVPELYDPDAVSGSSDDVWKPMATIGFDYRRMHHSSAVLLPDARVLVAGSNTAQIFSPPYLWTGNTPADRPIIDSVGTGGCPCPVGCDCPIIKYNELFTVNFSQAVNIGTVSLIRPGATTHGFDQEQRFMELTISGQMAGVLTVTAPESGDHAPPGYYMLFILDNSGVPSVAQMIRLVLDSDCPPNSNEYPEPAAARAPYNTPKNRYLSFEPNTEINVAFQLKLPESAQFPVGGTWWVDEPQLVDGSYLSYLRSSPLYRTWSESVIHIGDSPVVPVATYELKATCDGVMFSEPLVLSTILQPNPKFWGDVVGKRSGPLDDPSNGWTPPQGVVNIDDVKAAIFRYQGKPIAPPLTWVDVEPEVPNHLVNYNDVLWIHKAFLGGEYPFNIPGRLERRLGPPVYGDPATFTLVASSQFVEPGEAVEIEVFIDSLPDLGAYQVTLEVSGGPSAAPLLNDVIVESKHEDYVFAGLINTFPLPDVPHARVGNALVGKPSGVPVSGPGYLATFRYLTRESVTGDFRVSVVVGQDDTFLLDSSGTHLAYSAGSFTVIGVRFECHVDADCDDGNNCTIDTCVNHHCKFSNAPSGTVCDDGLFCTRKSKCDGNGTAVGKGSPCTRRFPVCCELTDTCVAAGLQCPALKKARSSTEALSPTKEP